MKTVSAVAIAAVVAMGSAHGASRAAGVGNPITVDGYRVTLLAAIDLTPAERETRQGASAGGKRLVWLIEPRERQKGMPVLGEVRLYVGGKLYNQVTNATSQQTFAPDIILHDFARFAGEHPGWMGAKKLAPRADSGIAEVIIRGGALKPNEGGSAELEIGVVPVGVQMSPEVKPRYVRCRADFKWNK